MYSYVRIWAESVGYWYLHFWTFHRIRTTYFSLMVVRLDQKTSECRALRVDWRYGSCSLHSLVFSHWCATPSTTVWTTTVASVASTFTAPTSTSKTGRLIITLCSSHLASVIIPNPPFLPQFPIFSNFIILTHMCAFFQNQLATFI